MATFVVIWNIVNFFYFEKIIISSLREILIEFDIFYAFQNGTQEFVTDLKLCNNIKIKILLSYLFEINEN